MFKKFDDPRLPIHRKQGTLTWVLRNIDNDRNNIDPINTL